MLEQTTQWDGVGGKKDMEGESTHRAAQKKKAVTAIERVHHERSSAATAFAGVLLRLRPEDSKRQ